MKAEAERQNDKLAELLDLLSTMREYAEDALVRGWITDRHALELISPALKSAIRRAREMSS